MPRWEAQGWGRKMDLLPVYPGLRKVEISQVWNLHLKPFKHFYLYLGSLFVWKEPPHWTQHQNTCKNQRELKLSVELNLFLFSVQQAPFRIKGRWWQCSKNTQIAHLLFISPDGCFGVCDTAQNWERWLQIPLVTLISLLIWTYLFLYTF